MISKIRDELHRLIISELEQHGVEGIVPSHGDILVFLYQKNGLSVKELAQKIHRKQPTVTVLVDKLARLGYVQRVKSEEDSRITLIHLTDQGRELEPLFHQISATVNAAVYDGFTAQQQEQLEQMLGVILHRVSEQ
ncbi:MarR family transcriptional regulator [Paenibacillus sp. WLX1005]|uniref:MarR family transcriptional regulator n=1 Tax=Paenibacillus sp. WLX1005 TaxID=3243766 RepID=UPI0039844CAA